ncbi:MAG: hypothetical protein ACTSU5_18250 [Promethearchaeota archaeon]
MPVENVNTNEVQLPDWNDIRAIGKNLTASLDHFMQSPDYQLQFQSRIARTIASMRDQKQDAENAERLHHVVFREY